MNTPTHLLIGLATCGKAHAPRVNLAAGLGALAPDISLYLLTIHAIWWQGITPQVVFDEYYFSETWQSVFQVDNSFILWGLLLGFAFWRGPVWLRAFSGAGVLHLCFDFPFHNDDARAQFWPFSDWVFHSPLSYWDVDHHGGVVALVEIALVIALMVILWRRHKGAGARVTLCLTGASVILPALIFSAL
ncbi:cobalamin biosynthesis protein CobQ [Halocynthiibacter sp.]|uniref:cobalamin biosynthesis protein CobQ n=1 Tax=Halocynthiibacter sp. TaxID=1979210 RepID=UPI003C669DB7